MTKARLLALMPARYDYRKKDDPYQEHKKLLEELIADGKIVMSEKTNTRIYYERVTK